MSPNDELRTERELRRAVERLPREVRPGRDLWPGVAARLEERAPHQSAAGWWRLAAAMLLVGAGLLTALALRPEPPRAGRLAVAEVGSEPGMAAARLRHQDGVMHAHNDLVEVVARRRGYLDEADSEALAAGLVELERAAREIEAALAVNPENRRLRLALAGAYRRESAWTSRLGHV